MIQVVEIVKTRLKILNLKRKLLINSKLTNLVRNDIEGILDDLNSVLVKNAASIGEVNTRTILENMYNESKDSIGCSKEEWIEHKTREWCN